MEEIYRSEFQLFGAINEVVSFNKTYVFSKRNKGRIDDPEEWRTFSHFNLHNLVEVVSCLDEVEMYTKLRSLRRGHVICLIDDIIRSKHPEICLFNSVEPSFHTMLDLKKYVVGQLFNESHLMELVIDLMRGTDETEDIPELLKKFKAKCSAVGIASLSFEVDTKMSEYVLIMSLLGALPKKIRNEYMVNLTKSAKPKIKHLIDFLRGYYGKHGKH